MAADEMSNFSNKRDSKNWTHESFRALETCYNNQFMATHVTFRAFSIHSIVVSSKMKSGEK
jgi:hypothetical protein